MKVRQRERMTLNGTQAAPDSGALPEDLQQGCQERQEDDVEPKRHRSQIPLHVEEAERGVHRFQRSL